MAGFRVKPSELTAAGSRIEQYGTKTDQLASAIEGECESVPKVGDVQATALYQQAHYDWTQTRFEDLTASAAHLTAMAKKLNATAHNYTATEAQISQAVSEILDQLDTPRDGTGH